MYVSYVYILIYMFDVFGIYIIYRQPEQLVMLWWKFAFIMFCANSKIATFQETGRRKMFRSHPGFSSRQMPPKIFFDGEKKGTGEAGLPRVYLARFHFPYRPSMLYLPTFGWFVMVAIGKYTMTMNGYGFVIHLELFFSEIRFFQMTFNPLKPTKKNLKSVRGP